MKEFKGTQGEWCRGGDMAMTYSDCVYNAKGETVCEVFSINSIEDAQLIAAAPELLEALMAMTDPLTTYYPQSSDEYQQDVYAIKKALGEDE